MGCRRHLRAFALSAITLLAPLGVVLAPRDGATVIVFSTDAAFAADVIGRADGVILAPFGGFGLMARSEQAGFAARLYRNGAVIVLGGPDRAGCLGTATSSSDKG